jgi:hypothetical protein
MKGVSVERFEKVNSKDMFVFGSKLRSGIYLIKIIDGDKYQVLKFIKQE